MQVESPGFDGSVGAGVFDGTLFRFAFSRKPTEQPIISGVPAVAHPQTFGGGGGNLLGSVGLKGNHFGGRLIPFVGAMVVSSICQATPAPATPARSRPVPGTPLGAGWCRSPQ